MSIPDPHQPDDLERWYDRDRTRWDHDIGGDHVAAAERLEAQLGIVVGIFVVLGIWKILDILWWAIHFIL